MENATKALLIAAAVLILLMLISLIIMFRGELAGYFTERHNAKMVEQLVEFNNKFENYNGQTIRGSELVSIMNKIVDYNNYQSEIVGYERVIIEIDFKSSEHLKELKYKNETGGNSILPPGSKINNETNDTVISEISGLSSKLVSESGILGITDTKLQKMSAQIANIVDDNVTDSRAREEYEEYRKEVLKRILGYDDDEIRDLDMSKIKTATYKYYQYTQFKRAMFKCKEVSHNVKNGRVNGMKFEVVLESDASGEMKIKFD